jgi:dTDP-4-amino-4,6-dideoxygalactose transaminase
MIPVARPLIGSEEEAAVLAVLRSGMIAQGPQVERSIWPCWPMILAPAMR